MNKNFLTVPVNGQDLEGGFRIGSEGVPLSPDELSDLAKLINDAVIGDRSAVWMDPLRDKREARVHGRPVELGGRAVRYVGQNDAAFFLPPQNSPSLETVGTDISGR